MFEYIKPWIRSNPLTLEQVEQIGMPTFEELEDRIKSFPNDPLPNVPFSFINSQWERLKIRVQPGDEFFHYRSPDETWEDLCGRDGYALVRVDKIVGIITVEVN